MQQRNKLICQSHFKKVEYININDDQNSKLACQICVDKNNLDVDGLLDLDSLFSKSPIKNISLAFQDEELFSNLNREEFLYFNSKKEIQKTKDIFNNYKKAIGQYIDHKRDNAVKFISRIQNKGQEVSDLYYSISRQDELKNKIITLSRQPNKLEIELKEIIIEQNQTYKEDKLKMKQAIESYLDIACQYDSTYIENQLIQLAESVLTMNIFKQNDSQDSYFNQKVKPLNPHSQHDPHKDEFSRTFNQLNNIDFEVLSLKKRNVSKIKSDLPSYMVKQQVKITSVIELMWKQNISKYDNLLIQFCDQDLSEDDMINTRDTLMKCQHTTQMSLNFSWNQIGYKGVYLLCEGLQYLSNLTSLSLNLFSNNIKSQGILFISLAIQELTHLTSLELNLQENSIEDDHVKQLCNSIQKCQLLNSLTLGLSWNLIGDDGVRYLADSLTMSSSIISLSLQLYENHFGSSSASYLIEKFSEVKNIINSTLLLDDQFSS